MLYFRNAIRLTTGLAGTPTTSNSRRHIANHDRPRPNNAGGTGRDALDDAGTGSDMGSLSDMNITGQGDSRRNVHVSFDQAVVVDAGSRVDDHICPETASRLHYRSRHDLDAILKFKRCSSVPADEGGGRPNEEKGTVHLWINLKTRSPAQYAAATNPSAQQLFAHDVTHANGVLFGDRPYCRILYSRAL